MKRWIKKIIVRIREGYLKEIYKETVWMYQYVKRYWFSICFYILAGVFGTVMGLGSSVVSKYLIDAVTGVRKDKILLFAVLIIGMTAAGIISNAVISRISARINVVIQNEIQADIFQKILYTEWKELQQFRSGDLLNRLSNDAVQVASSVISWIPNSITKLVQFIGAFAIIFYYDPVMAGIALLSAPVTVIFSRKFMGKMRTYNNEMREMTSSLMSFQDDTFQNIQTVKALDLTGVFEKKLQSLQNRQNPTVYLRTFIYRHFRFLISEAIHIGIKCEERIGIIQSTEEFTTNLIHPVGIKFQVIPRRRIGNHVPTQRIGAILFDSAERIYRIAQTF